MLLKELKTITEGNDAKLSDADVSKAISYLKSLGMKVKPTPLKNAKDSIEFEVDGMSYTQTAAKLDKITSMDGDDIKPNDKLDAGQGLNNGLLYYCKSGSDCKREILIKMKKGNVCTIELNNYED